MYVLYLGRYDSAASFTLDYVIRNDVIAKAPKCGDDTEPYPSQTVHRHCHEITEGREIPTMSLDGYRFEIYSTALLPIVRGLVKELPTIKRLSLSAVGDK